MNQIKKNAVEQVDVYNLFRPHESLLDVAPMQFMLRKDLRKSLALNLSVNSGVYGRKLPVKDYGLQQKIDPY